MSTRGLVLGVAAAAVATFGVAVVRPIDAATSKPNIFFVILDDVGIDLLSTFGNGGANPPNTPNINLIANRGVKFTNVWAMPECSPSRSNFFTGRYALRTGVEAAILNTNLPQSYVSSFETTLPRVLAKAGYTSALIGKYHLGNEQDPAGTCAPATRGFTYFQGVLAGGAPSVDTTAGGVFPSGSQVCGYYQSATVGGACYTAPGDSLRCAPIDLSNSAPGTDPARTCLQGGGIFVPNAACGVNPPKYSAFSTYNAYYAWPRTTMSGPADPLYVNDGNSCKSSVDRRFLTQAQGVDTEAWWKRQTGPRMATLSFNTIHTPVQKSSTDLVPDPIDAPSTCNNGAPPVSLINNMLESADAQIGRSLASVGLGTLGPDGRTLTSLNLGDTMIVVMGDNGSLSQTVRLPFDPTRAKATVYQTGVWVPLVIAGPMVVSPGRSVDAMINAVDLFQLFGDVAGIDVKTTVPPSRPLDSQPMLPYLTNPSATPIRTTNFTQQGIATPSPAPEDRSYPCYVASANYCNDTLFYASNLCTENGGQWFGPGALPGTPQQSSCCGVQTYLRQSNPNTTLTIAPIHQYAMRNTTYKLVENVTEDCSKPITNSSQAKPFPWADYLATTTQELYDLTPTLLNPKGLDLAPTDLIARNCASGETPPGCLRTPVQKTNYVRLNNELQTMKNSNSNQLSCSARGDGNLDMRINQQDIADWQTFNGKGPSRYDINLDGATDEADLAIIQANLGSDCLDVCIRSDLNRDGKVNVADMRLLNQQWGVCNDVMFCGGDLNGDGVVDNKDVTVMISAQNTCTRRTRDNRAAR